MASSLKCYFYSTLRDLGSMGKAWLPVLSQVPALLRKCLQKFTGSFKVRASESSFVSLPSSFIHSRQCG